MAKLLCLNIVILTLLVFPTISTSSAIASHNVLKYGAKPNGKTDSTQAFLDAWNAACASDSSTLIYVPKGRYLLGSLAFKGDGCKSPDITIRIDGTLVAPEDYRILGKSASWISFEKVNGVSVVGGALDAKGSPLWACKAKGSNCPAGATTMSFQNSNNIKISRLVSLNSQMFHIVINGCQDVLVQGVRVIAAGDSPNTDGIHVQLSKNVMIMNSSIKTGDDCISIGPGTENLWIEGVKCGPGHGISIGSLAKDVEEPGVQNVTVKRTIFANTQNGFRIKSWARPSNGFVQGVRFIGAIMHNVQNPILIDQHYCPHNLNCPTQVSGVQISDVLYQGIRGTSATSVAIKFDCSSKNPCKGIRMEDVNLTYLNQAAQSSCSNANGNVVGQLLCLYTAISLLIIVFSHIIPSSATLNSINVIKYGAKPHGKTDSTQAFLNAWIAACGCEPPTTIYVPKGRYLLGSLDLQGKKCKSPKITIKIDGTRVAPEDYRILGQCKSWIRFEDVTNTISFWNSKNIKIKGLRSINAQLYHIVINGCENVVVKRVRTIAPGDSPNTDGIHVDLSKNVVIKNSAMKTGDDCISIGRGTVDLWIEGVKCGPGHGISLAKEEDEPGSKMIKSWARHSNGFVKGVRFIGAVMHNVSGVQINDVVYQGIRGTSATERNHIARYKFELHQSSINILLCSTSMAKVLCLNIVILTLLVFPTIGTSSAIASHNVLKYGAKPNGKTDSTQAFLDAWNAACASDSSTLIYVPKGRYLLGSLAFKGDGCKSPEMEPWWLLRIIAYLTMSFQNSNNIKISRLVSLNSQMFHIVINGCQDVLVQGVRVIAAGDSPNTDGIHVQLSKNVMIMNSSIKTGDDCISIGPGTENLWIEGVKCGPGHGISIGSLAKDVEEPGVHNVTVKRTIFANTQNGFRIKSWARPSNGFVQGVRFIGAIMHNVQNPILIDQHYCPHNLNCPTQVSGVQISDVLYQGIIGTSATPIAIKFDCSSKNPCKGIRMEDVNLTYLNQAAQSSCSNANGNVVGQVQPNNCL
ncbi:hypothetical protein Tsubulata_021211, partial [Turnera subulata]